MSKDNKLDSNRVPELRGEFLYIPFVGAIIERETDSGKQVLVQVRYKDTDSKYKDVIEIPGGKFRAFEDVFETLKREVKEESGLDIINVVGEDRRKTYSNRGDTSDIIYPFCVTQMKEGPFIGLIFLCTGEGELAQKTDETKEIRWIDGTELKIIVDNEPERIYTAFLAPLKLYLSLNYD